MSMKEKSDLGFPHSTRLTSHFSSSIDSDVNCAINFFFQLYSVLLSLLILFIAALVTL